MISVRERIVYTGDDGSTKIIIPSKDIDENILLGRLSIKERSTADIVNESTIPQERVFRGAWKTKKGESVLPISLSDAKQSVSSHLDSINKNKADPRISNAASLAELKLAKEAIENE